MNDFNMLFKKVSEDKMIGRYVKSGINLLEMPYVICVSQSVKDTERYWAYIQQHDYEVGVYYFGDSEYKQVSNFIDNDDDKQSIVEFTYKTVASELLRMLHEGTEVVPESESSVYFMGGKCKQLGLKL